MMRLIVDLFSIDDLNKLIKLVNREHKKILAANLNAEPNADTMKWHGLLQKLARFKKEKQNIKKVKL